MTSDQEMLTIARKNGLILQDTQVEINESGMDFRVAFAKDEEGISWVLRQPRRQDVYKRAVNEHHVLKLVQNHLPVEIPNWRIFTEEIIAYPKLRGIPAATMDIEAKAYKFQIDHQALPASFIDSLASTLAALHGIDHEQASSAGIRIQNPSEARESMIKRMDQIQCELGVSKALWERWQKWTSDDTYWPQHSVLVHGDLHPPHILIDIDNRVSGLLDWTEAEVSNPATDFVLYYAIFGEIALDALLKKYHAAGGRIWPRMREHIIEQWAAYPVLIAMFALTTGKKEDIEMAQVALGVLPSEEKS
ncbi:hypothetical protein EEL31_10980 [Brevibacillus laterosporus]|nr:macrolide 2'-phosphotransferase [Brevibacillus laterosporus]TPG68997.1 hypothetical protein EEL31_10980 [Brevibacillus laterosporus]